MNNRWLYDGVAKAENVNTDDPNFRYNVGGTLWADWMGEYGVLKNDSDPIQAEDGNYYARPVFTSDEQAEQVISRIQQEHWNNAMQSEDPFLEFARTYTHGYNAQIDTMSEDSILRLNNYADILANHWNYGNQVDELDMAMGNVKNIKKLERYESQLRENYPNQEKMITEFLNTGEFDYDTTLQKLAEAQDKDPKTLQEEGGWNTFVDSFQAGTYHLIKDLGGSINWLDHNLGFDDDGKNIVGDAMKSFGETGTDGGWFEGAEGNQYITKEGFDFSDIWSKEFWLVDGARTIPAMMSFLIPGTAGMKGGQMALRGSTYYKNLMKMEKALSGTEEGLSILNKMKWSDRIATATSGAVVGRMSESLVEAGGNFLQMQEMGYSDEEAGRSARNVWLGNMTLLATDIPQLLAVVTKLPPALLPSFNKYIRGLVGTGKFGAGAVVEGYEEVLQNYFHHMGEASINDELVDAGVWDALTNMDDESKKAFALGTAMGGLQQGGFEVGNRFLNKDAISNEDSEKIFKDEYVRYQTLEEARNSSTKELNNRITNWLGKVSGLKILKDKLKIMYTDKEIQQVFTQAEIEQMGYTTEYIEEVGGVKIKEDHPRYNEEVGGDQYLMGVPGWNEALEEGGFGAIFGINADNHTMVEEITEIIYNRIQEVDPDLYNEIKAWEQRHQGKSNLRGRELFSSAFGFVYADIKESGRSADERQGLIDSGIEIDIPLFERFAQYFEQDGKNLLDELTDDRMQVDPGEIFMNDILNDVSDIEVYEMWEDRKPINMLMSNLELPPAPGSEQDLLSKRQEVNLLEDIIFGEDYQDPILYESNIPSESDEVYVPHKTKKEIIKAEVDPEIAEMVRQEKIKEEKLEEIRNENRKKRKEPIYNEKLTQVARSRAYEKSELESMIDKMFGEINNIDGGLVWMNENFGSPKAYKRLNKVEQVRQILKMKEYLDSKNNEQLDLFGGARFTIPSSMFKDVNWDANKKKIVKAVLSKYKDLKTGGALRIYIPEDLSKPKINNLIKLMTGNTKFKKDDAGKIIYKTDKKGELVYTTKPKNWNPDKQFVPKKIPLTHWTKANSGIFKNDKTEIDVDEKGRRYVQFNQKKQVSPTLVSYISLEKDAKRRGFKAKMIDGTMTYQGMTRPEYNDAKARAIEEGVYELTEQSDDVFNAILDMEYNKGNRPDFVNIALNWYTKAVDEAIEFTLNELPSLENKENQILFRALLGFTSPDNAVEMNENLAIEIYKNIEKFGQPDFEYKNKSAKKFKDSQGNEVGLPNSIANNIESFFELKNVLGGTQQAVDWMLSKHSLDSTKDQIGIVEMAEKIGKKTGRGDFKVNSWSYGEFDADGIYGMEVFGFKVGVFTGNLLGHGEIGTMDLWMTRQMGRWLGTPFKQGISKAEKLLSERSFAINDKMVDTYIAPANRQNFLLMRQTIQGIANDQRVIDKFGKKLEPMQVQALLWYVEKSLFRLNNARGQKKLGESDYGSWAKERQEKRSADPTYTGFKPAEKTKSKRGKARSVQGSGGRSLESITSEGRSGARFGRISLNSSQDQETLGRIYYDYKPTKEEVDRAKLHKQLYDAKSRRDILNTLSSQLGRIDSRLPTIFRQFAFDQEELTKQHMDGLSPLIKKLQDLDKRAKNNNELKDDYQDLSLYLSNGDMKRAKPLIDKHNLQEEISLARETLDQLQEQARMVGYDFGYINNYFPRIVTDHTNLLANLKGRIPKEKWELIEQEVANVERDQQGGNSVLADEQKLEIAEKVLLAQAGAFSSKPKNLKVRQILELDHGAFQYYAKLHEAMKIYTMRMSEAIMIRKHFGYGRYVVRNNPIKSDLFIKELEGGGFAVFKELINKEGKLEDTQFTKKMETHSEAQEYVDLHKKRRYVIHDKVTGVNLEERFINKVDAKDYLRKMNKEEYDRSLIPSTGLEETIEGFITTSIVGMKIDKKYEDRLRNLINTYFNRDIGSKGLLGVRKFGYGITLGSPLSAITQLGDLGMSTWMAGDVGTLKRLPTGLIRTAKSFAESLTSGGKGWTKDFISMQDMNIDVIQEELRPESSQPKLDNALRFIFKYTGFSALDRIGKETTINAMATKVRNALISGKGKTFDEVMFKLNTEWSPAEVQAIVQDILQKNFKSDIVRQWAFCQLAGVQPITKSEMPVTYLRHPNWRVTYQLKTFMLKRIDVYKDELRFIDKKRQQAEKDGDKNKARMYQLAMYQRVIMMATFFVMAEAGAEFLKDLVRGTDEEKDFLSDRVLGNSLKQVGLSKYSFYRFKQDGFFNGAISSVIPPVANLVDEAVMKDFIGMYEAYGKSNSSSGVYKYIRKNRLRSYRYIPFFGKQFYHWNDALMPLEEWEVAKFGVGRGNVSDRRWQKKRSKGQ